MEEKWVLQKRIESHPLVFSSLRWFCFFTRFRGDYASLKSGTFMKAARKKNGFEVTVVGSIFAEGHSPRFHWKVEEKPKGVKGLPPILRRSKALSVTAPLNRLKSRVRRKEMFLQIVVRKYYVVLSEYTGHSMAVVKYSPVGRFFFRAVSNCFCNLLITYSI